MPYDNRIPAQPRPPAGDEPDWSVVSLVDPEGSGADAAFTDGLHGFGLPELLLWARPTDGDDPGADWLLTHDDRLVALEQWAFDLLDGSLSPGDTRQQSFDHGQTTVSFRFGSPAPAETAGAPQVPADRLVIVVAWSLSRRAGPGPVDPASAALRRVNRWITSAEGVSSAWIRERHGPVWRPARPISAGRFGPMADWVTARVEQLCAAGKPVLAGFFDRIPAATVVRCEHCVHEKLFILASRHGRSGPAREASNTADLVAMALTDDAGGRRPGAVPGCTAGRTAWHAEVARVTRCVPEGDRDEVRQELRHRLRQSIESVLLAAVVADLAPTPLMASACGAWEWAVHGGRIPGRAWLAPAAARAVTRDLLTDRVQPYAPLPEPPEAGRRVGYGVDHGLGAPLVAEGEHAGWLIRGLQTVAAGSARPGWLSRGQRELCADQAGRLELLGAPLLTAVALPSALHPDTWQQLTAPLRPYLPGLPEEPPNVPAAARRSR